MSAPIQADPAVSVVICTRDRPAHLERALRSLPLALRPGDEVIVVDSASRTDETRQVAERAGVRVVRCDVAGLTVARNAGVKAAGCPIVAFTDDDCVVQPGWLDAIVQPFADPRVAVVSGLMIDPEGEELVPSGGPDPRRFERTATGIDVGHGANMAFRRSALVELDGFDERLGAGRPLAGADDLDMFCRLLRAGWTGYYQPDSMLLHRNERTGSSRYRLLRGYGLGLGALVAKMIRLDRRVGTWMLVVVVGRAVRRAVRVARARESGRLRRRDAVHEVAMLIGIASGLMSGLRLPMEGDRFIDSPPPPVASDEPVRDGNET